jgi:Flp pilus assembly pilin Flp
MIRHFIFDETAASMAEYALLLALVAVASIGALTVLRNQIVGVFDRVGTALSGTIP